VFSRSPDLRVRDAPVVGSPVLAPGNPRSRRRWVWLAHAGPSSRNRVRKDMSTSATNALASIRAGPMVLISDKCHAGDLLRNVNRPRNLPKRVEASARCERNGRAEESYGVSCPSRP
jgi:hypothetical protein